MKKFILLSLLAATAAALAPKPALAGDREIAAIGGFIGGLVLGSALHDDRYDRTTVVVSDRYHHRPQHGYWKHVTVKTWVPGYWTTSCDRYGRRVRVYVEGCWQYRTDRIWVSHDRHGRYGHHDGHDRYDRHDRRHHDRYDRHDRHERYGHGRAYRR